MKYIVCVVVLAACALTGFSADIFESSVPQEVIAYVYADVNTYMDQIEKFNPILDTLKEGGKIRESLNPFIEKLEEKLKEKEGKFDLDFSLKEVAGYFKTKLCFVAAGSRFAKPSNIPALMVIAKMGDNSGKMEEVLEKGIEVLKSEKAEVTIETVSISEKDFWKITIIGPDPDDLEAPEWVDENGKEEYLAHAKKRLEEERANFKQNPIIAGMFNQELIITNSEQLLQEHISLLKDGKESIAGNGAYVNAVEKVNGKDAPVKFFISASAFVKWLKNFPDSEYAGEEDKQKVHSIIDSVAKYGFSSLRTVSGALTYKDGNMHEYVFLAFPEDFKEGILRSILANEGTAPTFKMMNEKTFIMSGIRINTMKLYNEIVKLSTALNPGFPQILEQLKVRFKMMWQTELEEFIGTIAGDTVLYMYPNPEGRKQQDGPMKQMGMEMPDHFVVRLGMTDTAPFKQIIDALVAGPMANNLKKEEFMGETLYKVVLPPGMPMVPALAFYNGALIFSTSSDELAAVIRRSSSKDFVLADKVKKALDRLAGMEPEGTLQGFVLAEKSNNPLEKLSKDQIAEVLEDFADKLDIEFDKSTIPTYQDLEEYFNIDAFVRGGMIEGGYLLRTVSVNNSEKKKK